MAITDKYTFTNNTYIIKGKKLETEIGDIKQSNFEPQIKIKRWDNEVNASFRLIDSEPKTLTTEGETIKLVGAKKEIHFYSLPESSDLLEGGYEFEIILKEKPATNKLEFSIETKGLDFFYQPPFDLDMELPAGWSATKTTIRNELGEVVERRFEKTLGSYAVYHKDKPINHVGGKEYKVGKALHIYRPKIVDSVGNWVWGELNIDVENKKLTVTTPQDFLDAAVYPIRHAAGLLFGYDTVGTAGQSNCWSAITGSSYTLSQAGNAVSISAALSKGSGSAGKAVLAIFDSSFNKVAETAEHEGNWENNVFNTLAISAELSAADYWLLANAIGGNAPFFKYDSGATNQGQEYYTEYTPPYSFPASFTPDNYYDRKYSIYATYSPITLDAKTDGLEFTDSTTVSHTSSGDNRLGVAVVILRDSADTVTSLGWDGVGMTLAKRHAGNGMAVEIWYIIAPSTGNKIVSVTISGGDSDDCHIITASYNGVVQSSPVDNTAGDDGASGSPSVSITPNIDDCLVIAGASSEDGSAATQGSGESTLYIVDDGLWSIASSYDIQTTKEAQAMDFTGQDDSWAEAVVSFTPYTGGPSTYTETHTTDSLKRKVTTKTHTTDASREIPGIKLHTTDSFMGADDLISDFEITGITGTSVNADNTKFAIRFTARDNKTVDKIRLFTNSQTGGNFKVGLQADSSGEPSGTWLGSGSGYAVIGTWSGNDWSAYGTLSTSVALTSGTIYHIVMERDSAGSGNTQFRELEPHIKRWSYDNLGDSNQNTLFYNGSIWSVRDKTPIFLFEYTDATFRGQTNTNGRDHTLETDDREGIEFTGNDKTYKSFAFSVKKLGSPPNNIDYVLYNVTGSVEVESGTFAIPGDVTTSYTFIEQNFSSDRTFNSSTVYQLVLNTSGGDGDNNYDVQGVEQYRGPSPGDADVYGQGFYGTEIIDAFGSSAPPLSSTVNYIDQLFKLLADAGLQSFTKTHTTDSNKRKVTTKTHTTDASKKEVFTKTHTTDSFKFKEFTSTHTTDALKRKISTEEHSTDTFLYAPIEVTATATAKGRLIKNVTLQVPQVSNLGINYYHESMGYSTRTDQEINKDLDYIAQFTNKIKVYHSPYLNAGGVSAADSLIICKNITTIAKNKGFYVIWNENHDRGSNDLNGNGSGAYSWEEYASLVATDATQAEGVNADEFLVGNEISIHNDGTESYYDDTNLPANIKTLATTCKGNFSGIVSYQEGWWKHDSWNTAGLGSLDKIYFTIYEPLFGFKKELDKIVTYFGTNAEIGEISTRSTKSDLNHNEDDWTNHLLRKYDYLMQKGLRGFVFGWRETTNDSFGIWDYSPYAAHSVWPFLKRLKILQYVEYLYNDFNDSTTQGFSDDGYNSSNRLRVDAWNKSTAGWNTLNDYIFRGIVSPISITGVDTWRAVRLIVRYTDDDNYYFIAIQPNDEKIQLFRRESASESWLGDTTTSGIDLGSDYSFEVRISGTGADTQIDIFWQSEKIISVTDTGNTTLNSGKCGLRNNGAVGDLDNVSIHSFETEKRLGADIEAIANIKREFTTTHATNSNKRKAYETNHTTDALKREENTVEHSTDAFKKISLELSHTTDAILAKLESDNFNDNSLNPGIWEESSHSDSNVQEQNQRLELEGLVNDVSAYVKTVVKEPPQNRSYIIKVTQHGNDGGFKICPTDPAGDKWDVYSESNWYNFQLISGPALSPNKKKDGSSSEVGGNSPTLTPPYWMRIRVTATTIYFEYADQDAEPASGDWNIISSETWDLGSAITTEHYIFITNYDSIANGILYVDEFQVGEAPFTVDHSTDSYKRVEATVVHSTDTNKRKSLTTEHTTDANKKTVGIEVEHSTDANLTTIYTKSHITDANKRKSYTVEHTTDVNKRRTDTGWKSPSATGGTYNGWDTTPENAYASDDDRASTTTGAVSAEVQSYEDFNFGVPAGATIDGIKIRVEHYETGAPAQKLIVQWYSASDVSESSSYQPDVAGSDTIDTGGGAADLWGRTPIDTDFSNANFYVKVTGSADFDPPYGYFLDHIQIKVYYTEFSKTHTTDANKKKALTVEHSTDALKREELVRTHTTDSLLRKEITLDHTTDSFLSEVFTVDHSTDTNKQKAYTAIHTTDSYLFVTEATTVTVQAKADIFAISTKTLTARGRVLTTAEFLEGYSYRQPITIDNTSNGDTLTEYQVKVTIDHAQMVTDSKSNSDGSDFRFTDSDASSVLYFWVESGLNTSSCVIWVRVPTIPASVEKTIYFYYDPGTKDNLSNGYDTFDFFDDFEIELDTDVWDVQGNTQYSVSNSILQITQGAIGLQNALDFDLENGYMTEGRIRYDTLASNYSGTLTVASSQFIASSNSNSDAVILYMRTSNSFNIALWVGDGSVASYNLISGAIVFTSVNDTWYIIGDETTSSTVAAWKDYTREDSDNSVTWSKNINYISLGAFTGVDDYDIQDTSYDWVRARKFDSQEPTTNVESEETQFLNTEESKARIRVLGATITLDSLGRIEQLEAYTVSAKAWLNRASTIASKAKILNHLDVVSINDILLPIPSGSKLVPVYKWGKHDSIGGKDRREKYGQKYRYEIVWKFMKKGEYEILENLVNSGEPVTLKYERYPQSENGVSVLVKLGERPHVALTGVNDFYSSVTITAIETETT